MRRYSYLNQKSFKNASQRFIKVLVNNYNAQKVKDIIEALLTEDERIKIGRRIESAQMLNNQSTFREIAKKLKVGFPTISMVERRKREYKKCFELLTKKHAEMKNSHEKKPDLKIAVSKVLFERLK